MTMNSRLSETRHKETISGGLEVVLVLDLDRAVEALAPCGVEAWGAEVNCEFRVIRDFSAGLHTYSMGRRGKQDCALIGWPTSPRSSSYPRNVNSTFPQTELVEHVHGL